MIDLIGDIGFPVLLTARSKLGTLNHTMLSVEALKRRGLPIAAVLIAFSEARGGPEEEFVIGDAKRLINDVAVYGLPHLGEAIRHDPDEIAAQLAEIIPRDTLLTWFGLSQ
jgi:dethiobiotin synthetase